MGGRNRRRGSSSGPSDSGRDRDWLEQHAEMLEKGIGRKLTPIERQQLGLDPITHDMPEIYTLRRRPSDDERKRQEAMETMRKFKAGLPALRKKVAVAAVLLGAWYLFTTQPKDATSVEDRYPLPDQIEVVDSSVPYSVDSNGNKIVQTRDIDFSSDSIDITTDRYHFVKGKDPKALRGLGQVLSAPMKLFFWDYNIGWGADATRTRALLAMVEDDKDIDHLTIRVNQNAPLTDLCRLFTDPRLTARNNIISRSTLGVLDVLKSGIESKLWRCDYYNPFTQTAVVYSNVEGVGAHEIGHKIDFQRFPNDWVYALCRPFPPVMLYQEWRASQNAKIVLSDQDQWQFERYLIPGLP